LSDAKVYGPCIRALLKTASHICEVLLKSRTVSNGTIRSLEILQADLSVSQGEEQAGEQKKRDGVREGAHRAATYSEN